MAKKATPDAAGIGRDPASRPTTAVRRGLSRPMRAARNRGSVGPAQIHAGVALRFEHALRELSAHIEWVASLVGS